MDPSTTTLMPNRYVRVTGTLHERFVEFEFSIGDPVLAAELVLPFEQFREFCERHRVRHLDPEDGARLEYERMKWHFGEMDGIDC
jgi:phenol hydroxylase P0 protein